MQQNSSNPGWQGRKLDTPEVRHRWERAWTSVQAKEFLRPLKKNRRNVLMLLIAAVLLWTAYIYLLTYSPKKIPLTLISFKNYEAPMPPNLGATQDEDGLKDLQNLQFFSGNETNSWRDDMTVLADPDKKRFLEIVTDSFKNNKSPFFKLPQTRILYINGYGAINRNDEPCLILTGGNPLDEKSWLTMEEFFAKIKQTTSGKNLKILLVLDCVKEQENWQLGIIQNNWTTLLKELLEKEEFIQLGTNLTVLSSTSAQEMSHYSPHLKASVFNNFFKLGLAGLADKKSQSDQVGGNNDGRVSLIELKKYVESEVSRYVKNQYGAAQTPAFLTTSPPNDDFVLTWNLDPQKIANLGQNLNPVVKINKDELKQCWKKLESLKQLNALQFAPQTFSDWENRLLRAELLDFENDESKVLENLKQLFAEMDRAEKKNSSDQSFVSKANSYHALNIKAGGEFNSIAMRDFFGASDNSLQNISLTKLISLPDDKTRQSKIEALPIQDNFIASQVLQVKKLELWQTDNSLNRWLPIYNASHRHALPADLRIMPDIEGPLTLLEQSRRSAFDYLLIGNEVSKEFDTAMTQARDALSIVTELSAKKQDYYTQLDKAYSEFPYLAQWRLRSRGFKGDQTITDRSSSMNVDPNDSKAFLEINKNLTTEFEKRVKSLANKTKLDSSDIFEIIAVLETPLVNANDRMKLIDSLIGFNPETGDVSLPDPPPAFDSMAYSKHPLMKLFKLGGKEIEQTLHQASGNIREFLLDAENAVPSELEKELLEQAHYQRSIASLLTKFPVSGSTPFGGVSYDCVLIKLQNARLNQVLVRASQNALLDLYGYSPGELNWISNPIPVFQQLVEKYLKLLNQNIIFEATDLKKLKSQLNQSVNLARDGLQITAQAKASIDQKDIVTVNLTGKNESENGFPEGAMSLRFSVDGKPMSAGQTFKTFPVLDVVAPFTMAIPKTFSGKQDQLTAMFRGNHFATPILSEGFNGFTVNTKFKQSNSASVVLNGKTKGRPSILFALDCSQSMANEIYVESIGDQMEPRLQSATSVLKNLLDDFAQRRDSKIGVRLYGHRIGWSTDEPVRALTQDAYIGEFPDGLIPENDVELVLPIGRYTESEHSLVVDHLDSVRPWGQSPLYLTLKEAINDFATGDVYENPSIVVITDGLNYQFTPGNEITFAAKKTELKDLLNDINQLKAQGKTIPIYIMGFGISSAEQSVASDEFRQIEEASGGRYFSFQNERDLARTLEEQLQLGTYEIAPETKIKLAPKDNDFVKKLNEKITINETGNYQLIFDDTTALPFDVQGGESLQFFLGEKSAGTSSIESLPYQTNVIAEGDLDSPGFLDIWKGRMHRPKILQDGIEFVISLQSQSNAFSQRPKEIWIELNPKANDPSAPLPVTYVFCDRSFENQKNVPVMKLKAQGWDPQLANQGNCEIYCKWEKTKPVFTRPISDFINNQNLLDARQTVPGVTGLEFEIQIDREEHVITITEHHSARSQGLFSIRFGLIDEPGNQPSEIDRKYFTKNNSAVHTFKFPPNLFQKFLDSEKSSISIQTKASLMQNAYSLMSGKMEFTLVDEQGILPIDAATSDR